MESSSKSAELKESATQLASAAENVAKQGVESVRESAESAGKIFNSVVGTIVSGGLGFTSIWTRILKKIHLMCMA